MLFSKIIIKQHHFFVIKNMLPIDTYLQKALEIVSEHLKCYIYIKPLFRPMEIAKNQLTNA